ncbi:MAG: hypothetical protein AAFV45_07440 [Pseudomonadota bacterium]
MRVLTLIIASTAAVAITAMKAPHVIAADVYTPRGAYEVDRYYGDDRFRTRGAGLKDEYRRVERFDDRHQSYKDDGFKEPYKKSYKYDRYDRGPRHDYAGRRSHDFALHTPGILRRLERQKHRVIDGVERGDLTPREIRAIRECIEDIRYQLKYSKDDGRVTRRERFKIHAMLDDSARLIYRLKRNSRFVRADY